VLAPATLLQSRVAAITGGAVRIEGATGTVWHGTGTLVGGDSRLPVAWRIAPWSLLTGGLELKLGADERASTTPLRGDLTLDSGHLSLRDVEVVLPIAAVTSMARVPGGWIAGGDLHVHALAFDWAPPSNRGDAKVEWRAAQLAYPGAAAPVALGDVAIALTGAGEGVSGTVSNEGGDLRISGNAAYRAPDGLKLSLNLSPTRPDDSRLVQALSAIGVRDGATWRVEWRVPLR
jgi:hypothetical protein